MQLYILGKTYEVIGMVDTYESVLWIPKYNDVGECEIYVPCDNDYFALLKKGHYIYRYDDEMFCKIESVEIQTDMEKGDYLICTGLDIAQTLSGRVIQSQSVFSGKVVEFIERLLLDNVVNAPLASRLIPNFRIDTKNFDEFTETIEASAFGEDLLQRIMTTCKSYNLGFRVSYDISDGFLVFRLYRGKNKALADSVEYVEFSPQFANIISSNYKEDNRNYKNVACVRYKDADEQIKVMWVYVGEEPRFENRREISVDATGQSRDVEVDGEKITLTDDEYAQLIWNIGVDALAGTRPIQEYTGTVDTVETYEYKVDYNLGDIVKVINEYGIEAEAQVIEVMESDDNDNGHVIEPKFEYLN